MMKWDAEKNAIKREGALSFDPFVDAGAYTLNEITSRLAALRRDPIDVWGYDEVGRVKVIGRIVSVIFPSDGAKFAVKAVHGEGTGLILSAEDLGKTWWLSEEDVRKGDLTPAEKLYAMCRSEGELLTNLTISFKEGNKMVKTEAVRLTRPHDDLFCYRWEDLIGRASLPLDQGADLLAFMADTRVRDSYLYELEESESVWPCLVITRGGKLHKVLNLPVMRICNAKTVLK